MNVLFKITFILYFSFSTAATINFDGDINFLLYSRKFKYAQPLFIGDNETLSLSEFKGTKQSVIFIHEWGTSQRSVHITPIRLALLQSEDVNIITVDWHNEATLQYTTAKKLINPIAKYISKFIDFLTQNSHSKPSDFQIIGYGLGVHIAGNVGKKIKGIKKITAFDPQNELFSSKDPTVLKPEDAKCIYVIYSTMNETSKNYIPIPKATKIFIINNDSKYDQDFNVAEYFADCILHKTKVKAIQCDNLEKFNSGKCSINPGMYLSNRMNCVEGKFYV